MPRLLFYCQHAVGLGHLARSLALADGLARRFDVVLLNGGRLPAGTQVPDGVRLVNLPALGHDDVFDLVSHEPNMDVADIVAVRPRLLQAALHEHRPDVVLVELFPFGRKKFSFELLPFLEATSGRAGGPTASSTPCSCTPTRRSRSSTSRSHRPHRCACPCTTPASLPRRQRRHRCIWVRVRSPTLPRARVPLPTRARVTDRARPGDCGG
jgi:hypothetical protein